MTYEKAVEHFQALEGQMIEAHVRVPKASKDSSPLACVVGRVREVKPARVRDGWLAWLEEDGEPKPMSSLVLLDRRTFEAAWTRFDGSTFTLSVRHAGVVTDIAVWI